MAAASGARARRDETPLADGGGRPLVPPPPTVRLLFARPCRPVSCSSPSSALVHVVVDSLAFAPPPPGHAHRHINAPAPRAVCDFRRAGCSVRRPRAYQKSCRPHLVRFANAAALALRVASRQLPVASCTRKVASRSIICCATSRKEAGGSHRVFGKSLAAAAIHHVAAAGSAARLARARRPRRRVA